MVPFDEWGRSFTRRPQKPDSLIATSLQFQEVMWGSLLIRLFLITSDQFVLFVPLAVHIVKLEFAYSTIVWGPHFVWFMDVSGTKITNQWH